MVFDVPGDAGESAAVSKDCRSSPCMACTQVTIFDDNFYEDRFETFGISLLEEMDQGVHFLSSTATVVIIDDDSK